MQRHSSNLSYHVESVKYQVSALSDHTLLAFVFFGYFRRINANCLLIGKSNLLPSSFPIAACALHEENLNERADITCPLPCIHQNQSVQTLWLYGGGTLVENSSPDPLPTVTFC